MFTKGNKIGNRFSTSNQPAMRGKGRKPNLVKKIKDTLSSDDCRALISSLLMLSREEINEIAKNKEIPIFQAVIAKALAAGDHKALMEFLRFTYGTKSEIDAKVSEPALSHEEVAAMIANMLKREE